MSSPLTVFLAAGDAGSGLSPGATVGIFVGIPVAVVLATIAAVYLPDRLRQRRAAPVDATAEELAASNTGPAGENEQQRARRARSFGAFAEHYDRARPAPSREALAWTLPDDATLVAELGAGTGKATRGLVELAERVVALEPDERMHRLLREHCPEAATVTAAAEAIPLADGRVDAVLAASAWHWFGQPETGREVARVLRPGGRLAVVRTRLDTGEPWRQQLAELRGSRRRGSRWDQPPRLDDELPFTEWEFAEFELTLPMTREELVAWVGSHSSVAHASDKQREQTLEKAGALVRIHAHARSDGRIPVPFRVACWRAERR